MRVLFIEDDVALNGILAKRLAEEGHSVDCCFDGDVFVLRLLYVFENPSDRRKFAGGTRRIP